MATRKPLILVVDDDRGLLKLLKRDLEMEDYQVATASDGETGLRMIRDREPDLVLLDILMPGLDGFEVCELARRFSEVPIIMLTARSQVESISRGLEIGADDYVVKPFGHAELVARIQSVLRRYRYREEMPQAPFRAGGLHIDFSRRLVTVEGRAVRLPPTEYRILCVLARNADRVVTHEQLLSEVWGKGARRKVHGLQVATNRLREKIGDDPTDPRYIFTRSGVGYMLSTRDTIAARGRSGKSPTTGKS